MMVQDARPRAERLNSSSAGRPVTCEEFQARMPELARGRYPESSSICKTCARCAALLDELEYIASIASDLLPVYEPGEIRVGEDSRLPAQAHDEARQRLNGHMKDIAQSRASLSAGLARKPAVAVPRVRGVLYNSSHDHATGATHTAGARAHRPGWIHGRGQVDHWPAFWLSVSAGASSTPTTNCNPRPQSTIADLFNGPRRASLPANGDRSSSPSSSRSAILSSPLAEARSKPNRPVPCWNNPPVPASFS